MPDPEFFDHDFHDEGRPVLPLASADRAGVVGYVGSLAKILAPGLRLGYVAGLAPSSSAGRRYAFDGKRRPYVRLAFASLSEPELADAVRRLGRAFDDCGRR